jgi:hypothetical protein
MIVGYGVFGGKGGNGYIQFRLLFSGSLSCYRDFTSLLLVISYLLELTEFCERVVQNLRIFRMDNFLVNFGESPSTPIHRPYHKHKNSWMRYDTIHTPTKRLHFSQKGKREMSERKLLGIIT